MARGVRRRRIARRFRRRNTRFGRLMRRFKRRGIKQTASYTTQFGGSLKGGFRSSKLRKRRWRGALWSYTLCRPHFRSVAHRFASFTSTATPGNGMIFYVPMIGVNSDIGNRIDHVGSEFWVNNGGVQPLDEAEGVGPFRGDIVIRGGMCRYTLNNSDTADAFRVKVFAVWANTSPKMIAGTFGLLPQFTTRTCEWDPSVLPDFQEFGRVLYNREVMITPGNSVSGIHRLHTQKIDQEVFRGEGGPLPLGTIVPAGMQPYWFFQVIPVSAQSTDEPTLSLTTSFNLSFVGDQIAAP